MEQIADQTVPTGVTLDFDTYVAARSARFLRTASLLVGTTDAADVVQDALVGLYRKWGRVVSADNPDAYVQRALVNAALQWRRRRRRSDVPGVVEMPGHAESVTERQDMLRALSRLPPRQRAVVVLAFYEDRSEADIAAVIGCSRGTVKSQKARAIATLRAAMRMDAQATESS